MSEKSISIDSLYAWIVEFQDDAVAAWPLFEDILKDCEVLRDGTNVVELLRVAMAVAPKAARIVAIFRTPSISMMGASRFDAEQLLAARIDGHRVKWVLDFLEDHPAIIKIIFAIL